MHLSCSEPRRTGCWRNIRSLMRGLHPCPCCSLAGRNCDLALDLKRASGDHAGHSQLRALFRRAKMAVGGDTYRASARGGQQERSSCLVACRRRRG